MFNQPLPHNNEIEQSVLGCLMLDKADYVFKLTENDFYGETNKQIYKAIRYLADKHKTIDIITVSDLLKKKVGNALELTTYMINFVPTAENIEHYIETLKQYTLRREIIRKAMESIETAYKAEYETCIDLKNDILQKFDINVYDKSKEAFDIKNIMVECYGRIEERYNNKNEEKLYTGFYDLDKITAGLHKEEMTIIAARPGVGKTSFAIQLILNLAKRDNCCVLFSREMSKGQIVERIISNLSGLNSQKIRFAKTLKDEDWEKIGSVSGEIAEMPIFINDKAINVQEIRAYCRELKNKGMLDVIVVDYLQLCRTLKKTQNREREVAEVSWELKTMAKEFEVPVVVLSQFSRNVVKEKREPTLSDLRDSGALEQDADNVIFLHLPEDTNPAQEIIEIKVIIGKQRNGPTGHIWLKYSRKNFRFWSVLNRG